MKSTSFLARALCVVSLAVGAFLPAPNAAAQTAPVVGDIAPDFTFLDFEKKEHRLSEFKGKPVILDFWATWCGPCIAAIPGLSAVHDEFKDKNFIVLSISLDDKAEVAQKVVAAKNMIWPQGHVNGALRNDVAGKYAIQSIPSVWLIGADGKIKATNLFGTDVKTAAKLLSEGKLEFAPDPALKVSGTVVDEDGKPIAGAGVFLYAMRQGDLAGGISAKNAVQFLTTDEKGIWTYDAMFSRADQILLGTFHYDYDSGDGTFPIQPVKLKFAFYKSETKNVLHRGIRVNGTVKDTDGKPVAGVPVNLGGEVRAMNKIPPRKTDADGKFYYTVAKDATDVTFSFNVPGFAPESKKVPIAEAKAGVELVLKPVAK
ncbi:MAG: redoxin domain-containing protein [Puniceicoccales bacterium]|jgi:thiol-disulfide isomerase/thioredoxin|nr:redoxin domain-containing protein [Puniceicoccales bacterium]